MCSVFLFGLGRGRVLSEATSDEAQCCPRLLVLSLDSQGLGRGGLLFNASVRLGRIGVLSEGTFGLGRVGVLFVSIFRLGFLSEIIFGPRPDRVFVHPYARSSSFNLVT